MRAIHVRRPGLLTTIQDAGRFGYQAHGVPVAGPMDAVSFRLANALVGNDDGAATLEVTLVGPELEFEADAACAITGADLAPTLDAVPMPMHETVAVRAGQVIGFGGRRAGARAYVAVDGGIDTPPVLGSRATHVLSRMGGVDGRALVRGDRLPIGAPRGRARRRAAGPVLPGGTAALRVLGGPHAFRFASDQLDTFYRATFTLAPASNRMGYRLEGPSLAPAGGADMISQAVTMGAIQVPASGHGILLMADRQTTGGYPVIATVISADLPAAGQMAPGDTVRFVRSDAAAALAALVAQERRLLGVR